MSSSGGGSSSTSGGARSSEVRRLVSLAALHALVMAMLYLLKPVRSALFLDRLGVAQLPYATIAVAFAGAAAGGLYARLAGRVRTDRLATGTYVAAIVLLGVLSKLIDGGGGGNESAVALAVYVFYVTVAVVGVIATSLVWLLANEVFDAREARRRFGAIGAAGIAGAVGGGLFTKWAVHAIGTSGLIYVAMGLLGASAVIVHLRSQPTMVAARSSKDADRASERDLASNTSNVNERAVKRSGATSTTSTTSTTSRLVPPPSEAQARKSVLTDIYASKLLRGITTVAVLGGIVSVIVDIQYNDFVARTFATREEKAAFIGIFSAGLSAFAFFFQLVVTPRILTFSIGVALLFLPVALGAGSLALVIVPSLAAAGALKLADGGLRHSIHKAGSELLLSPLSTDVRARAKLFLDVSVTTASEAMGAGLVLLFVRGFGLSYPTLGVLSLLLIGGWLALASRTPRAYVDAFRQALEKHKLDLTELRTNVVLDTNAIASLTAALGGTNERAMIYSLDLLAAVREPSLVPAVTALLTHPSAEVRQRAVRVLRVQDEVRGEAEDNAQQEVIRQSLAPLVRDDDADVRAEAMLFVGRGGRFRELLADPNEELQVRVAALAFVAEEGTEDDKAVVDEALLRSILAESSGEANVPLRAQIARALGGLPKLGAVLRELALDPSHDVVERAIASAGRTRDAGIIPWIVGRLGQARYRKQARDALASFDLAGVDQVGVLFDDAKTSRAVLLQLPRVLAQIPQPASVRLLERMLGSRDGALVLATTKALAELSRKKDPRLAIDETCVHPFLLGAIQELTKLGGLEPACAMLDRTDASHQLLTRALRERRAALLERIFRLLALLYSPKEMNDAYHGVLSRNRGLRAHAIEFLDNVVDKRFATPLAALLEQSAPKPNAAGAGLLVDELLGQLASGGDSWLRACAVTCASTTTTIMTSSSVSSVSSASSALAASKTSTLLKAALAKCVDDPNEIVREAAAAAFRVHATSSVKPAAVTHQ